MFGAQSSDKILQYSASVSFSEIRYKHCKKFFLQKYPNAVHKNRDIISNLERDRSLEDLRQVALFKTTSNRTTPTQKKKRHNKMVDPKKHRLKNLNRLKTVSSKIARMKLTRLKIENQLIGFYRRST